MKVEIIQVPYDSGHFSTRTGCGPDYYVDNGLHQLLQEKGHQVHVQRIQSQAIMNTEIATAFELNRLVAEYVATCGAESLPLIFSGNCNTCVGAISGLSRYDPGLIWFDAHGDFNTPETTVSGFLDGMGLAMATGRCWRALLHQIPGYQPVPERNVIQAGARDLDAAEQRMFEEVGIPVISPEIVGEDDFFPSFKHALNNLHNRVENVYLHLDMDVLNTGGAKANHLAVPGGLSVEMVATCIELIKQKFTIRGCGIASVDPTFDKDKVVLKAGFRLVEEVLKS